jgi:predicted membrane-bound mannosyltransferase
MSSGLSLENYLFGPLDKRYCLLFYVFGVIMFFVFIVGLLGFLYNLFKGKKMSTSELFFMAYSLLASFLGYLTYRLLHTMCVSSAIAEKA